MSQWSKPYQKTRSCKTEDGRDYQVVLTYINLLSARPFQQAEAGSSVSQRLINVEISGKLEEEEALEIMETLEILKNITKP